MLKAAFAALGLPVAQQLPVDRYVERFLIKPGTSLNISQTVVVLWIIGAKLLHF